MDTNPCVPHHCCPTFNDTIHGIGPQINIYQAEPSHHNHLLCCSPSLKAFFGVRVHIFTHLKDSWVSEWFDPGLQCLLTPTLFPEAHVSSHLIRLFLPKMPGARSRTSHPSTHSQPVRPMFPIHCGVNVSCKILFKGNHHLSLGGFLNNIHIIEFVDFITESQIF